MRNARAAVVAAFLSFWLPAAVRAENVVTVAGDDPSPVRPRNVTVEAVRYGTSGALEIRLAGAYRGPDMDTFAYLPGLDFHDGTIEVDVAGSILPTALAGARGFVGVAFRISESDGSFACEGIYIRPANGRADDQVRRNHSTQYFSYPGWDFDRLRREAPREFRGEVQRAQEKRIWTSFPSSAWMAWNGVLKPRHLRGVRLAVRTISWMS